MDKTADSHRLLQMIITFGFVDVSWVFFRAGSTRQALSVIKRIIGLAEGCWFTWGSNLKAMGLTKPTRNLLVIALAILLAVDVCKYKGIDLIDWLCRQGIWLRWLVYYGSIFGILIFGVYGPGYVSSKLIYLQFYMTLTLLFTGLPVNSNTLNSDR